MTVGELKLWLQDKPDDTPVLVRTVFDSLYNAKPYTEEAAHLSRGTWQLASEYGKHECIDLMFVPVIIFK